MDRPIFILLLLESRNLEAIFLSIQNQDTELLFSVYVEGFFYSF